MNETITNNPMYRFLMILTIASTVGLQAWRTLFDNFAVRVVALEGRHIGIIQSVREVPGFLSLAAIYIFLIMKEHRLSAASILVLGLGLAATGLFPSFTGLLITTLMMSFGFHYFETTNQSLTLQHFDERISPLVLGKLRSIASASNIGVGLFIFLISNLLPLKDIYLIIGVVIIGTGFWGFRQHPVKKSVVPQQKKLILKKKYRLYYYLIFMAGARRQIFVAFAVFLLVKKFNFTIQEISILFIINNVINYFLSPLIGKGIVAFGEKNVLSIEYFSLVFIFLAYAYGESKLLMAILYILDHIFFNFAMAIRTYFQKIGDPEDIAPTMAVGFTINHIAAVFLPAMGGFLWMVDYRIPFISGAVMSLISLWLVRKINTGPTRRSQPTSD